MFDEQKIEIFDLDTPQTVKDRLANERKTLSKYIFIKDYPKELTRNFKFETVNVLDLFSRGKSVADVLNLVKKTGSKINIRELVSIWIMVSKTEEFRRNPALIEETSKFLSQQLEEPVDVKKLWEDNKEFRENFQRLLDVQKFSVEERLKSLKYFNDINSEKKGTDYIIERTILRVSLNLTEITILELFNAVILSPDCPFISFQEYYKILEGFSVTYDWLNPSETLDIRIRNKKEGQDKESFTTVSVNIEGEIGKEIVQANMKIFSERGFYDRDEMLEKFLNIFSEEELKNVQYKNIEEIEIAGIFLIPSERFNIYVFSDLVMNDPIFSSLITIDESAKATKKKGNAEQSWVHLQFFHPKTGKISASISQKIALLSDPYVKKYMMMFKEGEPYIRVRAKGSNIDSLKVFQTIFLKLLVIYDQKYNGIVKAYRVFVPNFADEKEEKGVKKENSRVTKIASHIFSNGFSRNCAEERIPVIANETEAKEHEKKGGTVMIFPRKSGNPPIPSDGKQQYRIICKNPKYPYPGLQHNKLKNNKEYPFTPCCFKNPQDKKGGLYRHYFYGEDLDIKEKNQQELISTDKILSVKKFGILPVKLQDFFRILDPDEKYMYVRFGTVRNKSSFLNAVMYVADTSLSQFSPRTIEKRVKTERSDLGSSNYIFCSAQCDYESSLSNIRKSLKDATEYLDPKKTIQMLERYYNIKIFLFEKDGIILPNFEQGYYEYENENPCVFVYQHMGSESDHAEYPQCELIVKWNVKNSQDIRFSFENNENIYVDVKNIYERIKSFYVLNQEIRYINVPFDRFVFKSQEIDNYGKTRKLNTVYKESIISLFCDPIPPLPIVVSKGEVRKVDVKTALAFLEDNKLKVESQFVIGNSLKEISFFIGNVRFFIAVNNSKPIKNLENNNFGIHYSQNNVSFIETFNMNKKISRYLTEYLFWTFSKYIHERKKEVDAEVINGFSENIVVINGYEYGKINKIFSENSSIYHEGKIAVYSEELKKRLLYVLYLFSIRNRKVLFEYKDRTVISNYYSEKTDFTQRKGETIIKGKLFFEQWMRNRKIAFSMEKKVILGRKQPYFFRNSLISDDVYIAQNTSSLDGALYISDYWNKTGTNIVNYPEDAKMDLEFTLCRYVSPTDIEIYRVTGKESEKPIIIIGCKQDDTPFFVSLLKI